MNPIAPLDKTYCGLDLAFEGDDVPEHFADYIAPVDIDALLLINRAYRALLQENEQLKAELNDAKLEGVKKGVAAAINLAHEYTGDDTGTSSIS